MKKTQSQKFKEKAKELKCEDDQKAFDKNLKKITKNAQRRA